MLDGRRTIPLILLWAAALAANAGPGPTAHGEMPGEQALQEYVSRADSSHRWRLTHRGVLGTAKFLEIMKLKEDKDGRTYQQIEDYNRQRKNSVIKDPQVLLRWINRILSQTGATQVNVKSAGLNQWWVGGYNQALYLAPALEKVANDYGVSAGDALGILLDAQKYGRSYSFVLDSNTGGMLKEAFEKTAQPPMQEQPMQYQGSAQGAPLMGGPGTPPGMTPQQGQEIPMAGGAPAIDPMTGQPVQQPQQSSMSPTDQAPSRPLTLAAPAMVVWSGTST